MERQSGSHTTALPTSRCWRFRRSDEKVELLEEIVVKSDFIGEGGMMDADKTNVRAVKRIRVNGSGAPVADHDGSSEQWERRG